jgi:hypothetical protein
MWWSNEQRAFAVEAYFSKKEASLPHPVCIIVWTAVSAPRHCSALAAKRGFLPLSATISSSGKDYHAFLAVISCFWVGGECGNSILILGFCILLRVYHHSSSSTVRNSSLCFTLHYTIDTTCFGLTYRPSSGVIYK